jgi:hypothetical protein
MLHKEFQSQQIYNEPYIFILSLEQWDKLKYFINQCLEWLNQNNMKIQGIIL